MKRHNPTRNDRLMFSRRKFLLSSIFGGIAISSTQSDAFTVGTVNRVSDIGTSVDVNGILGLQIEDSVTKGFEQLLVTLTNNSTVSLDYTLTLLGETQNNVVFSTTGTESDTVTLDPTKSVSIRVDVDNGNLSSTTLTFRVEGTATNQQQSISLTRSTTIETNPTNPPNGEIQIDTVNRKGKSRQYEIDWSTGTTDTQNYTVSIYVNNTLQVEGLETTGTEKLTLDLGDEIRVSLLDTNNTIISSDNTQI
jgi:hypothetical protein